MKNQRDSFIIHRAKEGDIKAFAELVSKYKDMIFSVVMKITGNREDAEDLLQEIFIKIYRTMDQFRETSEFSTWIYRIAYTTTISELRKRKVYFSSIEDNTTALETADVLIPFAVIHWVKPDFQLSLPDLGGQPYGALIGLTVLLLLISDTLLRKQFMR